MSVLLSNEEDKRELKNILGLMNELMRQDFSFSDFCLSTSFYNLSLYQDAFTLDVTISKQLFKEIAIKPLYDSFTLGKTMCFVANSLDPEKRE